MTFAAALFAGVLSFLSPCVLPLVPAYLGYISGVSFEEISTGSRRGRVLVPAVWFVLGFSLVFMALGARASQRFRRVAPLAEKIAGGVLILFGILLITGSFTSLSALLARYTPDFLLERL